MYRVLLASALLAAIMPEPSFAQSDSALAWVREAPRRAKKLAGCYELSEPIRDSISVPRAFRLSARKVLSLGHHGIAHFWTDLPPLGSAETRPIWTPQSDDSIDIELAPSSTGLGTRYHIVARIDGDSLRGAFEERSWVQDSLAPLGSQIVIDRSSALGGWGG